MPRPIRASQHAARFPRRLQLFLALCSIALAAACAGAPAVNPRLTGAPFLTTWAADDYGGAPINYHVVQHPQTGFVYVGNPFGVLEFDGAAWRLIRTPGERVVPMVVVDALGTVWIGGSNEVGILRPGARGELQAVDVTARLPAAERNFGRIYLGTTAPDGVYLAGPSRLLFFGHDGSTRTWRPGPTNFNGLCWHDGALHASLGAGGLARVEGDTLVPVAPAPRNPNPAIAPTLRLFAVRAEPGDRGALFLTNIGPMRWAGRGQPLEPLTSETGAEFARENATTATFLTDGRLAFSFPRRGLLILESSGAVSSWLDRTRGLGDSRIDHLATDNQGGLWLARLNGLARLQLDSRFALHGDFDATRDLMRHGSRLYVAHYQGASWRDDATGVFHSVANLPAGLKSLLSIGDRVFGTGQFLYEIRRDGRAAVVLPLSLNGLIALRGAPGYFAGASVAGLRLLRFDDRGWRDVGLVSGINGNVRAVIEDRDGWLWALGYHGSGSWRVDFRSGASLTPPVEFFDEVSNLPHGRKLPTTTIASEIRAMRGDSSHDVRASVPSQSESGPAEAQRIGPLLSNASIAPTQLEMLLSSPPEVLRRPALRSESRTDLDVLRVGPLRTLVPKALFTDHAARTLWLGGQGALVSIDPAWRPAQSPAPFHAAVRRLVTRDGDLLWAHGGAHPPDAPDDRPLALASAQNTLRVTYAAPAFIPDYRGVSRTVYRTRLEGLERTWTTWSPTPWREFTDLPYRDFVFHVQARDINDRESSIGVLAFAIASPWWRTWWFLGVAGASGLVGVAGVSRWYATRALQRRLQLLEAQSAVERERLRLARDLHDEVGSGLGRVILFAGEAERAKDEPEKLASLARVRSSALELVQHAREIVWAVSPQHDTLASVIERFGHYTVDTLRAAGIACNVELPEAKDTPPIVFGSEVRHSLFLALKEAVHNCVKYSGAKTAELRLAVAGDDFVVVLRDHGRGFVMSERLGTGHGTINIVARAEVLGGRAEITSEVGRGTTVTLRVPLVGPKFGAPSPK